MSRDTLENISIMVPEYIYLVEERNVLFFSASDCFVNLGVFGTGSESELDSLLLFASIVSGVLRLRLVPFYWF